MFITKISLRPKVLGRKDIKKISCPLADHDGARLHQLAFASPAAFGVRLVCWLPSEFMRKTEQYPSRKLINAMFLPSGDQTGIWAKLGGTSLVSWTGAPLPSAL